MKVFLLMVGMLILGDASAQNNDSLVDKNKESIALLKQKIANLENGTSSISTDKKETLEKEIIVYRDSIVYLTKELEVCAAEKKQVETSSNSTISSANSVNSNLKEGKNSNILFSTDIYKLNNKNEKNLDMFTSNLPKDYHFIIIKGHADKSGESILNETISRKRANSIKEYLIKEKNIAPDKIMINWFGSDMPSTSGDDKRCELSVI